MPDSESSETNIIIITRRDSLMLFCKLYWRILVVLATPLILLPIAFIGENNAYKCFYVFLITITYWITDALHPCVVALVPVALSSIMGEGFIDEMYIRNEMLDCLGVMLIIVAAEESQLHRRCALKMLLVFGCSHYRLSFLLFFLTMFLSMWITSIITCALMLPIVKAILQELEKMGILEMYQIVGKVRQKSIRHGESNPRPTDITIFYFLGIAYSSSIGASATLIGSQTNQILKIYCETFFPLSPRIEFPHFMLLNLPGVLVLEVIVYLWMNFYFLKMCRAHSDLSLEIGMTEEEAQYINTLLASQYQQMGKITYFEWILGSVYTTMALMQPTISTAHITDFEFKGLQHEHLRTSSPIFFCTLVLFVIPKDLNFLQFFKKRTEENSMPLPQTSRGACLTWSLVKKHVDWSALFIIGGSSNLFYSLRDSQMTYEIEKFLLNFTTWPTSALMLAIIIFFKIMTEFAPNSCVAYCLLPNIARLSIHCGLNPHYLMMAGALSASLPCHLANGAPANALVASYVHIPPWKMMKAGMGVSIAAVVIVWFTVAAWATAVWTESYKEPTWAYYHSEIGRTKIN